MVCSSFFELPAMAARVSLKSAMAAPASRFLQARGHGNSSFVEVPKLLQAHSRCRSSFASSPWPLQLPGIFKLAAVATLSNLAMAARVFEHHIVEVNLEDGSNEDAAMGGSKLGDSVVGVVAESRR
ncbi:hypothetical protein NL676_008032 [Syzygium grande]|nr:hypothetical protein NL676_008032 [Syzygium grande]